MYSVSKIPARQAKKKRKDRRKKKNSYSEKTKRASRNT
jgi:transposase